MAAKPRKPRLDKTGKIRAADQPLARRKREPSRTQNTQASDQYEPPVGDKKCSARKQDGSTCKLPAGWNTDHPGYGPCSHHFGSTPGGRKGAAYDMAAELSAFYGEPIDTNPIDALLNEVNRTAGHVEFLRKHIAQMSIPVPKDITDKKQVANLGLPPEQAGWIALYLSERAQLVRVSTAALNAGINERLVQIAEHQGTRLADAVDQILSALNLTAAQQALVPEIVPNALRGLLEPPRLIEGVVVDSD